MSDVVYRQEYRLDGLPKWVFNNECGAAWIDTQHGRYWLKPGDVILYDAAWNPIDVERRPKTVWVTPEPRCPQCSASLLTNGRMIWCSMAGCDYGLKERILV